MKRESDKGTKAQRHKAKRELFLIAGLVLSIPVIAPALEPATVTITNSRNEAVAVASGEVYYRGDVVNFTNCIARSGWTNSAVQDLSGLTVVVTVGDLTLGEAGIASQVTTGTVTSATGGLWTARVTLRTNEAAKAYCETMLTDTTNTFRYPFKYLETKEKL